MKPLRLLLLVAIPIAGIIGIQYCTLVLLRPDTASESPYPAESPAVDASSEGAEYDPCAAKAPMPGPSSAPIPPATAVSGPPLITKDSPPVSRPSSGPPISITAVQRIRDSLQKRNAILKAPEQLDVNEVGEVELTLSKDIKRMEKTLKSNGQYTTANVSISGKMQAKLYPISNVKIQQAGTAERFVGNEYVKWVWGIQSERSGTAKFMVELSALVKIEDAEAYMMIKSFDHTVAVRITKTQQAKDFLSQNWKWIAGTGIPGLGAAGAGFWALRRRRTE